MFQLAELIRYFTAAGSAPLPGGQGMYLLYSDDGTLVSKYWNGTSFDSEEVITNSVRPGSVASYILTKTVKKIICISAASSLRVLSYDDQKKWYDEQIPTINVHLKGQLVAEPEGNTLAIVYQNEIGGLMYVDSSSWQPIPLPVDAVEGTPLSINFVDNKTHVFYLSSKDSRFHACVRASESEGWLDAVDAGSAFTSGVPKRIMVGDGEDGGAFGLFVLTDTDSVVTVTGGASNAVAVTLGVVHAGGEFEVHQDATRLKMMRFCCFGPRPFGPPPYCGPAYGGGGYNTNISINGSGNSVNVWN